MNSLLLLTPIVFGGLFVARHLLTPAQRDSLARMPATMMKRCMEHMPEDSPPKIMTSGVRRIQAQNDEILALLREQNELLRCPRELSASVEVLEALRHAMAGQPARGSAAPGPMEEGN